MGAPSQQGHTEATATAEASSSSPPRRPVERAEPTRDAYYSAISIALLVWAAASFAIGIALALARSDVATTDVETVMLAAVLGALAIGIVAGIHAEHLRGGLAWLLVSGGAIVSMFVLNVVTEVLGEGAFYGTIGGLIAYQVWWRRQS